MEKVQIFLPSTCCVWNEHKEGKKGISSHIYDNSTTIKSSESIVITYRLLCSGVVYDLTSFLHEVGFFSFLIEIEVVAATP